MHSRTTVAYRFRGPFLPTDFSYRSPDGQKTARGLNVRCEGFITVVAPPAALPHLVLWEVCTRYGLKPWDWAFEGQALTFTFALGRGVDVERARAEFGGAAERHGNEICVLFVGSRMTAHADGTVRISAPDHRVAESVLKEAMPALQMCLI